MNKKRKCVVGGLVLITGLLFIAGCTLSPAPAGVRSDNTPAPFEVRPDNIIEFTSFVHPEWGYSLAVPKNATISHSEDGHRTTFEYEDNHLIYGSYTLEVEVVPQPGTDSPDELVQRLTYGAKNPSPARKVSVEGGRVVGAAMSYEMDGGKRCPHLRVLDVVFIEGGRGYILRIRSDAPGRCEAESVPQTEPVVDSFRIPNDPHK